MENSPELQIMNRRVLEALSILQDAGFDNVSLEAIIEKVVPMIQRDDDLQNLPNNIMESLSTLKQVGLVRESRNSEFILCRCPVKSKSATTRKRKSSETFETQKNLWKMRSLLNANHKPHKVMCTECRSALSTFTSCYEDLRQGRTIASKLQLAVLLGRNQEVEPVETIGDVVNLNATGHTNVEFTFRRQDGSGDASTPNNWTFNSPIPIHLKDEHKKSEEN
ncbi:uncharacterized protein LOC117787442 [Drosophila innubila]|uniref:uncharacterized protein LOC117787442 n=1 Tax=Drosophila innubila TaxID=198719 RepID=UPI00148C6531|nr:uncharacterized protein LOC117787442 [Drosophila innubila]